MAAISKAMQKTIARKPVTTGANGAKADLLDAQGYQANHLNYQPNQHVPSKPQGGGRPAYQGALEAQAEQHQEPQIRL